jgi:dienelactone hydrolase
MTLSRLFALLVLCLGMASARAGEQVVIPSLDGKLAIPGNWFPVGGNEPRPALITLHGCGGAYDDAGQWAPNYALDASFYNAERIHLLGIDSFTPRGQKSLCETKRAERSIDEYDRREDVAAALRWLAAQPGVDKERIVILGRSHGAQTVLRLIDKSGRFFRTLPVVPRAVIALYPGCDRYAKSRSYQIGAPLLLMIGADDDWTPSAACMQLRDKIKREQLHAVLNLRVFADSYHGFDGTGPVHVRTNIGSTASGSATVGGNPAAREEAHHLIFAFLSAQLGMPLLLSDEERYRGHRFVVPPPSQYAAIGDLAAVPLGEKGRARFQHYRDMPAPKAFVISEKGGWHFSAANNEAMQWTLSQCASRCWLYAVDNQVVWKADPAQRVSMENLVRKVPAPADGQPPAPPKPATQ